jgi:hypothetical protein
MSERRLWSHDEITALVVELVGHGQRAAIDRAVQKMQRPRITPGTVTGYDPAVDVALVELDIDVPDDDEEPSSVPAQNLLGCPLLIGQRVMFQFEPPHGGFVVGYIGPAQRPWAHFVTGPGQLFGSPGVDDLFTIDTVASTIEALAPAIWLVSGVGAFSVAFGTASYRFLDFRRLDADGVTETRYYGALLPPEGGSTQTTYVPTAFYLIPLGPGDTLQFRARQNSGGPLDLTSKHISLAWYSGPQPTIDSGASPPPSPSF